MRKFDFWMSLGNLYDLHPASELSGLEMIDKLRKIVSEGFKGVNGTLKEMAPELFRSLKLDYSCTIVFDQLYTGLDQIERAVDLGVSSITVLLGDGFNTDTEIGTWMEAILQLSKTHDTPVLFEIHRGTVTQDSFRTLHFLKKHSEIRFTADFSHWYTGLLLGNGFNRKVGFLSKIFEHTDCVHGRFASNSCIQQPIEELSKENIRHFKELWLAVLHHSTHKGQSIPFVIELLSHKIGYCRKIHVGQESMDSMNRWDEALKIKRLIEKWSRQKS